MKRKLLSLIAVSASIFAIGLAGNAQASTLWVGEDTANSVQRYTSTGVFIGSWGASGATGTALDGAGHVYTVQPGGGDSAITKYDASQTLISTSHFTTGIENGNGFPSWIEDMTYGGSNTLWVSGFNGIVYNIDSSGTILSYFDTGHIFTGIATDGTYLYTDDGFSGGGNIYKRLFDGTIVSTISTGFDGGGGIGFDSSDNTLWVGYLAGVDDIRHFDMSGNLLSSLSLGGSAHDGLEVGEINVAAVPEPSTLLLLGSGMTGFAITRIRRLRKKG